MADNKSKLQEFKEFLVQGNVIDLAVAVIIALYFGPVVKDVVNFILQILAIPGKKGTGFAGLHFTVGGGVFQYGNLVQDIITFVAVAAAVFFIVVLPVRALMQRMRSGPPSPASDDRPCPFCLSQIPKEATRCRYCTAEVPPLPTPVG